MLFTGYKAFLPGLSLSNAACTILSFVMPPNLLVSIYLPGSRLDAVTAIGAGFAGLNGTAMGRIR
jgi:hypothetical protein